ncbi:MAG: protein GlxC [Rhodobacteraceae bacterium]|nr:protein GlxC [Paracoccaceae bacterium]
MKDLTVTVGDRPIRQVNAEIRDAVAAGRDVTVTDTKSRHNLAIGMDARANIRFEGSVGYYCGGLNCGARIQVERNAGWAVGEAMSSGEITVGGYAGMSAGTSMLGGLLHIKGNAGPRCGVAMKGGDIIVEGRIGYLSGFMAHAGRIIALEGAGDACADSLWGGEVWLAGPAKSLGVDTRLTEPSAEQVQEVEALLAERGLADSSRDWRKIVSAQRLWHFQSRDAKAWLMI